MPESLTQFTAIGPHGKAVAEVNRVKNLIFEGGTATMVEEIKGWKVTLNKYTHGTKDTRDEAVQWARELAGTIVMR